MNPRRYLLISFPILLAWGLAVTIFVPWFEYTTRWNPPKWSRLERTCEQLRVYEFGPDRYPRLENSNTTGCYVPVFSGITTHSWDAHPPPLMSPFRLHLSTLTELEVDQIRFMRLMGLFLFGISLILNLIFSGLSLRNFISNLIDLRLRWYKYSGLAVALVLLSGVCLFGILLAVGPIVGTPIVNGVRDPLPGWQNCPTIPIPNDAGYSLAEWEFNRILYLAPGLMSLNVLLTAGAIISWQRRSKKQ